MRGAQAGLSLLLPLAAALGAPFSGVKTLELTRKIVAFGPRPSGSEANANLEGFLEKQLIGCRCAISRDKFTAATPAGPVSMTTLIAWFPGTTQRAVAITGHFDTKRLPGSDFIGANDGGSSTAFLLEIGRILATEPHRDDVLLIWFDGEEAVHDWSATDSLR